MSTPQNVALMLDCLSTPIVRRLLADAWIAYDTKATWRDLRKQLRNAWYSGAVSSEQIVKAFDEEVKR